MRSRLATILLVTGTLLASVAGVTGQTNRALSIREVTAEETVLDVFAPLGQRFELLSSPDLTHWFVELEFDGTGGTNEQRLAGGRDWPRHFYTLGRDTNGPRMTYEFLNVSNYSCPPMDAAVPHPFTSTLPVLITNVAFEVDGARSLTLAETADLITNAAARAALVNASIPPRFHATIFHSWPNILNLTEIFYRDSNLASNILKDILRFEDPNNAPLVRARLHDGLTRGDRVFLARDFYTTITVSTCLLVEVHFAMAINLDAREAFEIQAHGREAEGLGRLTDPRVAVLNTLLQQPAGLPLGPVWDLCLRGNILRQKYHAIVVDKLDEPPATPFWIERVHLLCDPGHGNAPPLPAVAPWDIPRCPPWWPFWPPGQPLTNDLIIIRKPPRRPDPPMNPHHPPPPPLRLAPVDRLPADPWPFPDPDLDQELPPDEPDEPSEGGVETEPCDNTAGTLVTLMNAKSNDLAMARSCYTQDRAIFDDKFGYVWPVSPSSVAFKDPALQALFGQYIALVAQRQGDIVALRALTASERQYLIDKSANWGALEELAAFYRGSAWANLVEVGGSWRELSVPCMPVVLPGPGGFGGLMVEIGPEQQLPVMRAILYGVMNGATWNEAVDAAIRDLGFTGLDVAVWRHYAACLKRLMRAQMQAADFTEDEIRVMFDGIDALPRAVAQCIRDYLAYYQAHQPLWAQREEQIRQLENEINETLRRRFRAEAIEQNFRPRLESNRRCDQELQILRAFLIHCQNPSDPEALPLYSDLDRFCSVLGGILANPAYSGITGLRSYVQMLINVNCP
ncbi:MAG TPA: hypothetical protein VNO52_02015 [Methylomirabilota bacterium]|nr:hypothetical protein [Methylomirabilota bacterium]